MHASLCSLLAKLEDITFAVNIYLAYFLWEELELPSPAKPPTAVLTMDIRVLFDIFEGKMEEMMMNKVFPRLVLSGS